MTGQVADLNLQQVLPDGKSSFADVLLSNAEPTQVCQLDGPPLAGQELQCVQAGTHIALCLLAQLGQSLRAAT